MGEETLDLLERRLIHLRVEEKQVRQNYRGYVQQLLILWPGVESEVRKAIQEANSLEELDGKLVPHF